MSKLSELGSKFSELKDKARDSEAFQQLKSKYEELDAQTKLYINLGGFAAGLLIILATVISGISTVNSLASDLEDKEELIGWLQLTGDNLKNLKSQFESSQDDMDINSPLNSFLENASQTAGMNPEKITVGAEKPGTDTKEAKEFLCDVKMSKTNLKALTRYLFAITDKGQKRRLTVKDLTVDTKDDPEGYIDVSMVVAGYKAK